MQYSIAGVPLWYSGLELGWGAKVPGSDSSRRQLHGLGVRHFKVSGGVPSPPGQNKGRLVQEPEGSLDHQLSKNKYSIV